MSMADKLREGIQKKKNGLSSEQEVRDLVNSAASKALKLFIQRMEAGEIAIDNISDFIRVLGAYKEINEIGSALDGKAGMAALPELDMRKERVINDNVEKGVMTSDEEGNIDVSDMSAEELAEVIRQMDIAQNSANEETF